MSKEFLFDKSLQKINFLFRLTGLNINSKKRDIKQNFVLVFNLLWHQTSVILSLSWVVCGILKGKNFMEISFVTPCSVYGIVIQIKAILILHKKRKVHSLMDTIRDLEIKAKDFPNPKRDNLIKPEIKLLDIAINSLNVINFLLVVVFDICPPFLIAAKYYRTGQLELVLPYLDIYPFDSFDPWYWPFAYIHQFWTVCFALLVVSAIDYFFIICCTHIRVQFKLLQHEFQEFTVKRSDSAVDKIEKLAKFQQLITFHQETISAAEMLEGIYSKSTLSNFVASSVIICLTGFNVTIVDDKPMVAISTFFLLLSLLQVFFLCLLGDLLMSSSLDVADAVYNSRWYLSDVVMQKNILLVQTRAQTPCKLTAAGFADVNLRAYMKIISTSWSYFTLLQTVYSERS